VSGTSDRIPWSSRRWRGAVLLLGIAAAADPQIRWSWFARRFILGNARPGSIVILHDHGPNGSRTVQTLTKVLPELVRRGFRVVTLGELVALSGTASGVAS
jgi:hypothetical protein